MTERKTILSQISSVPSMPAAVMELRKYLNDPNVSFEKLAKVIEYDPGLTVNVLQLANSAYFGWTRTIKTVKEAITRLGTNRVFQMVLCMSVAPLVRKPIRGYEADSEGLWKHSIAAAICAEQLVRCLHLRGFEEAFTAGLLHDMGKVVLGTFVEIDDQPIKDLVLNEGLSFDEAEFRVLGIDHAEVAAEMLRIWNLPEGVVAAARWHHQPQNAPEEHRALVDLIHVADYLSQHFETGSGIEQQLYRHNAEAHARLNLSEDVISRVGQTMLAGVEELGEMFASSRKGEPAKRVPSVI
jgi:putative nucleotidyltransferase with HDIG domain